jgi:hypothetical protein
MDEEVAETRSTTGGESWEDTISAVLFPRIVTEEICVDNEVPVEAVSALFGRNEGSTLTKIDPPFFPAGNTRMTANKGKSIRAASKIAGIRDIRRHRRRRSGGHRQRTPYLSLPQTEAAKRLGIFYALQALERSRSETEMAVAIPFEAGEGDTRISALGRILNCNRCWTRC